MRRLIHSVAVIGIVLGWAVMSGPGVTATSASAAATPASAAARRPAHASAAAGDRAAPLAVALPSASPSVRPKITHAARIEGIVCPIIFAIFVAAGGLLLVRRRRARQRRLVDATHPEDPMPPGSGLSPYGAMRDYSAEFKTQSELTPEPKSRPEDLPEPSDPTRLPGESDSKRPPRPSGPAD